MVESEHDDDSVNILLPAEVQAAKANADLAKWEVIKQGLKLTEEAGQFIGKIVGPAAEAAGGILGDQFRYWRVINANRLAAKMALKAYNFQIDLDNATPLPFGNAVRALDAATMEDDESVLDLWAKLLVRAIDPSNPITIKKPYVDLLKSFGSAEAILMEFLWQCYSKLEPTKITDIKKIEEALMAERALRWGTISQSDQQTAIQNLIRLRCIAHRPAAPSNVRIVKKIRDRSSVRTEVDERALIQLLQYLENTTLEAAGVKSAPVRQGLLIGGFFGGPTIKLPELNLLLTALGRELMAACNPVGDEATTKR